MLEYNALEDKWVEILDDEHKPRKAYNSAREMFNDIANGRDDEGEEEDIYDAVRDHRKIHPSQPLEYNKDIDWEDLKTVVLEQYSDSRFALAMPFSYNNLYAAMEEYYVQKTELLKNNQ